MQVVRSTAKSTKHAVLCSLCFNTCTLLFFINKMRWTNPNLVSRIKSLYAEYWNIWNVLKNRRGTPPPFADKIFWCREKSEAILTLPCGMHFHFLRIRQKCSTYFNCAAKNQNFAVAWSFESTQQESSKFSSRILRTNGHWINLSKPKPVAVKYSLFALFIKHQFLKTNQVIARSDNSRNRFSCNRGGDRGRSEGEGYDMGYGKGTTCLHLKPIVKLWKVKTANLFLFIQILSLPRGFLGPSELRSAWHWTYSNAVVAACF